MLIKPTKKNKKTKKWYNLAALAFKASANFRYKPKPEASMHN